MAFESGGGMQHQVKTGSCPSNWGVVTNATSPIGSPPFGAHVPGTYVRSVISLLLKASPGGKKFWQFGPSDPTMSEKDSFVLQVSSLYTRNVPKHVPPDASHVHSVQVLVSV